MSSARAPFVIVIRNGPIWKLDGLVAMAETLGRRYTGEVWTYADSSEEHAVGSFRVRRDAIPQPFGTPHLIWWTLRLLARGVAHRWLRGRRLVVITYDPFRMGSIGVGLKLLTGAKFVCEVNGMYADPNNLLDMSDREAAAEKRSRMITVASRTLRRADHIKLLFPTQLEGFSRVPPSIPRSVFLDFVDASRFPVAEASPDRMFLFIGHPYLRKGVDVLLEAFARFQAAHADWRLVLIGFQIEKAARTGGLPLCGVEFPGPQSQTEVSRWLERCRALVLPSRSEAMGRVLLEAAFKGRPRLGSRVGGIPHYIEHEVDGLLFEPDDVKDLERALRRIAADDEAWKRLGSAARARAERDFTPARYLESYEAIISSP